MRPKRQTGMLCARFGHAACSTAWTGSGGTRSERTVRGRDNGPFARRWQRFRGRSVAEVVEPETFDRLYKWVRDDSEITSPRADRFEHSRIAHRIADRLRSGNEAPTLAVIGPLGSGKSSVRRLTERALRHDRRVRIVPVSLWPFDSPEAAVRGILRALVQELGRHVGSRLRHGRCCVAR